MSFLAIQQSLALLTCAQLDGYNDMMRWYYVVFEQLHLAVVAAFEEIASNKPQGWTPESRNKAASLLRAVTDFSFIVAFTMTANVLARINSLTVLLQGKTEDIGKAYQNVLTVKKVLPGLRENVEQRHAKWWEEAVAMAEKVCVEPSAPRVCYRQTKSASPPADTAEQYYQRVITVPLLDEVLSAFNQRFDVLQQNAALGMALVPLTLCNQRDAKSKEKALQFAEAF